MIEREWNAPATVEGPSLPAGMRPATTLPRVDVVHKLRERLTGVGPAAISLLGGAIVWEVVGQLWDISFLPPFSRVVLALVDLVLSGAILGNLARSMASLALGYSMAVIVGVTVGLLMGRYPKVEYLLDPYLTGLLAAPNLIFVPILYAFFGVSRGAQVAVIFLSAVFVIVLNTMNGLRTIDKSYLEMARSFGAKERQLFWKILLPGSFPITMAGIRLAMGRAVKGMINGEMFIALFGLGALLRRYGNRFDAEHVFAILAVVVSVALVCNFIVQGIERRLTHWSEPTK